MDAGRRHLEVALQVRFGGRTAEDASIGMDEGQILALLGGEGGSCRSYSGTLLIQLLIHLGASIREEALMNIRYHIGLTEAEEALGRKDEVQALRWGAFERASSICAWASGWLPTPGARRRATIATSKPSAATRGLRRGAWADGREFQLILIGRRWPDSSNWLCHSCQAPSPVENP